MMFAGIRLGVAEGFSGVVLAELLITPTGIGDLITYHRSIANFGHMYAVDPVDRGLRRHHRDRCCTGSRRRSSGPKSEARHEHDRARRDATQPASAAPEPIVRSTASTRSTAAASTR